MLAISATRSSATSVSSRPYRPPGTTRADLQSARFRHPAPPPSGLSQPLLDSATLLMAQDERWQEGSPTQARLPKPESRDTGAYSQYRTTPPDSHSSTLEYTRASDGQFYAIGAKIDPGAFAEPAATLSPQMTGTLFSAREQDFSGSEGVATSPRVHREVSAYQHVARLVAEPLGLVTLPPSVEVVV